MQSTRTVLAYFGCDAQVVDRILAGEPLCLSDENYAWPGTAMYVWEYGLEYALLFAERQNAKGKVQEPAVLGVVLQLGNCFDLLDTRFTSRLARVYPVWREAMRVLGKPVPHNHGHLPDWNLGHLDCALLHWYLEYIAEQTDTRYDTVRWGFREGGPMYPGSCIYPRMQIQIAVRHFSSIVGVFRPNVSRSL